MDLPIDQPCPTCSQFPGEMIFEGVDALANFCGWILGDDNKGVTCIAYNFGGYHIHDNSYYGIYWKMVQLNQMR